MKRLFALLWLPIAVVSVWWMLAELSVFPPFLLPSPADVAKRAFTLVMSGELFRHAAVSLLRVFLGFLISAGAALSLAALVYESAFAEKSSRLCLESLRVIPPLSLIPLLILWLGIGEAPKLAIVILASFFPVYLSTLSGLRSTGEHYLELAQSLGLSRREIYRHILIPGAAPSLVTGLRLGFGYAWRALVSAELIAAASGLGYLIEDAGILMRTDVVLVGVFTIAVLGIACDRLFAMLLAKILPSGRLSS